MHSPRQLESAFYIPTSKDKSTIFWPCHQSQQNPCKFCKLPGQTQLFLRPLLEARDKILLKWKSEVARWYIDKKEFVPRYFKFQLLNKPKRTSCMTILMEMGIKKATSKAARSQLLIDTTQVPEAHSEIGWQVMQCIELTYSMFSKGHETEQKVRAIACTS